MNESPVDAPVVPGEAPSPRQLGRRMLLGSLVADAIAMPVHWYYNQSAIDRDYGSIDRYHAPRPVHPDSILWRSSYTPLNERGDILREQAAYWGQRGVHYHQFLEAGQNTLNASLAVELFEQISRAGHYDPERWLDHYVAFMLTPGRHRDTYVEEYHRHFFTNLASGRKPINCGVRDIHIGGLVGVPALVAAVGPQHGDLRDIVRTHVSLTHKDAEVLEAADCLTRMLARMSRGGELRETILDEAPAWISRAKLRSWEQHPDRVLVGGVLSSACYITEAFPAALALAWRHAGRFAAGVCANALVGGDSCHRGAVVGSLLASASALPENLVAGLGNAARIHAVEP
jgi:ADP-ribosyl-[dinitrogen reductase] hydrolase